MEWSASFFINSIFLGVGLAMDAFTVSLVNGLSFPNAGAGHAIKTAGTFAFFQALMPMTGWVLAHSLLEHFSVLGRAVPWISASLLSYIGIRMIKDRNADIDRDSISRTELLAQGVATSIDALSAGLTISCYGAGMAGTASLIIAGVTFVICWSGVCIGKRFGLKLAGKASVLGGIILIGLAVENIFRCVINA